MNHKKHRNIAEMVWNAIGIIGGVICIGSILMAIFIDIPGWLVFTALFLVASPMIYWIYDNYMTKKRDRLRIHKRK